MHHSQASSKRSMKPKREHSADRSTCQSISHDKPRKRQTAFACVACRRRKSRCDSARPACSACTSVYRTSCVYENDADPTTTPASRRPSSTVDDLSNNLLALQSILGNLQSLPNADGAWLEQLNDIQSRVNSLQVSSPHNGHISPSFAYSSSSASDGPTAQHLAVPPFFVKSELPSSPAVDPAGPSAPWLDEPLEQHMVEELFDLYFRNHHAYCPAFSRIHFIADFHGGAEQHCSSMLVYAILALACQYWRAKICFEGQSPVQAIEWGTRFAKIAAVKCLKRPMPCLTTIQALSILAIRYLALGNISQAYKWHGQALRMAWDMDLQLDTSRNCDGSGDDEELALRRLTFWSVFNIETALNAFVGRVSFIGNLSFTQSIPYAPTKRDSIIHLPPAGRRYTHQDAYDDGQNLQMMSCLSELSHIINNEQLVLYAPNGIMTSLQLRTILQRYDEWEKRSFSVLLRTCPERRETIHLSMYYNQSRLQLVRPFTRYGVHQDGFDPSEYCTKRATEILFQWRILKQHYRISDLHVFIICTLRDAAHFFLHNLADDASAQTCVSEIISDLSDFAILHPLASCVVDSLQNMAVANQLGIPPDLFERHNKRKAKLGLDHFPSGLDGSFIPKAKILDPNLPTYSGAPRYPAEGTRVTFSMPPQMSVPTHHYQQMGPMAPDELTALAQTQTYGFRPHDMHGQFHPGNVQIQYTSMPQYDPTMAPVLIHPRS